MKRDNGAVPLQGIKTTHHEQVLSNPEKGTCRRQDTKRQKRRKPLPTERDGNAVPCGTARYFRGTQYRTEKAQKRTVALHERERQVEKYREAGINWWDYCGSILVNSYPTYFEKLPPLIGKINREKRSSKNYVLFLGSTGTESNQAPCLSLVQFQIEQGELVLTAYQRSSDANLGLPADIYHLYLISRQIELPLKSITINLGNVHIYENNVTRTQELLAGNPNVKFELNV